MLLSGINALFWSSYAIAIKDLYILIPNAIGAALCTVQAALCLVFGQGNGSSPSSTEAASMEATGGLVVPTKKLSEGAVKGE